jgi:hypothetical protein
LNLIYIVTDYCLTLSALGSSPPGSADQTSFAADEDDTEALAVALAKTEQAKKR